MSEELVKFKGSVAGVQLVLTPSADFIAVETELRERLESGSQFFRRGTVVQILPGSITEVQAKRLTKLFHQHGVFFRVEDPDEIRREQLIARGVISSAGANPAAATPPAQPVKPKETPMRVINRTVRSGESITARGGVLVVGNVNPGSEIIAGGSIDIRGTCRGLVHAGAFGDRSAVIIADRLMPVQIRIADLLAQPPEDLPSPTRAERAVIRNNEITIEPIER